MIRFEPIKQSTSHTSWKEWGIKPIKGLTSAKDSFVDIQAAGKTSWRQEEFGVKLHEIWQLLGWVGQRGALPSPPFSPAPPRVSEPHWLCSLPGPCATHLILAGKKHNTEGFFLNLFPEGAFWGAWWMLEPLEHDQAHSSQEQDRLKSLEKLSHRRHCKMWCRFL